ncbi:MAG: uroporphyrinogen decarboxylase family protein [Candidatus Bathyarchaeia archaeon]
MTPRERMLAVFTRQRPDRIVWQPRIYYWYEVNKALGTIPARYRGKSVEEVLDELNATPRTSQYYGACLRVRQEGDVKVTVREEGERVYYTYVTPRGELHETLTRTDYMTLGGAGPSLHTEYLVKDVEDFKPLEYIIRNQSYEFDMEMYERIAKKIGDRAESIIGVPHQPIQRLNVTYMGFAATVKALWKHPKEVDEFMQVMEEDDDKRFKVIEKSPIRIVNFGDNIHDDLVSPTMFKKYALPYYRKRTAQMHAAGKFCISHWDGRFRRLLPFIKETGLDALECVAPAPQGDFTSEELREAMGDMALMDGLPAVLFLPHVSYEELRRYAERTLELFSPRIILGIGDMLPPEGDIEKVRMIGEMVQDYTPP